ncbi:glycosyltransferase [Entomospira entomophila]|uniref:Glycosyltransferase family 8 protein n=1 Tax=Entomospira entomophila TaxID=2719988 RepID=A0A968KVU4_9SPIO|nr:glycosyltransferase [Entomospira entomophilus]NIZ40200.1 hypothetical protein [Entomospira entomophilus]WDI35759.1 glycosyltransferase [Entomospira entomophilus]
MRVSIAYAITENYVKQLLTSITSIFDSARSETSFSIYVAVYQPSEVFSKLLQEYIQTNHPQSTLEILSIQNKDYQRIPVLSGWLPEASFRLLLPRLLPEKDRILYLDADTIIMDDLSELMCLDMKDIMVAGVMDIEGQHIDARERLIYLAQLDGSMDYDTMMEHVMQHGYINSGVLLMNLAYWREANITDQLLALFHLPISRWVFPDQDFINYAIMKKGIRHVLYLPVTYNCMELYYPQNLKDNRLNLETAKQVLSYKYRNQLVDMQHFDSERIKIIHMVSQAPWQKYQYPSAYYSLYKPYAERVQMQLPTRYEYVVYTMKKELHKLCGYKSLLVLTVLLGFISALVFFGEIW